jgi:hypothetical protein
MLYMQYCCSSPEGTNEESTSLSYHQMAIAFPENAYLHEASRGLLKPYFTLAGTSEKVLQLSLWHSLYYFRNPKCFDIRVFNIRVSIAASNIYIIYVVRSS